MSYGTVFLRVDPTVLVAFLKSRRLYHSGNNTTIITTLLTMVHPLFQVLLGRHGMPMSTATLRDSDFDKNLFHSRPPPDGSFPGPLIAKYVLFHSTLRDSDLPLQK